MSVSMYTGQVRRLSDEIVSLKKKAMEERRRLSEANSKTLRATEALSKASSVSQLATRARELERYEKQALAHEKKLVDLEKSIAAKERQRDSAQGGLDRALASDQRKADGDAKKREQAAEKQRKADLEHMKVLERGRRLASPFPTEVVGRPSSNSAKAQAKPEYDVCLSFAGEQRDYVERIAEQLAKAGLKVFYDQDEAVAKDLWGKDLGEHLDYVYRMGSRYCVMFISSDYARKEWTRHERRSALARAIEEDGYVLPARFDDTELEGLRPTISYVDLRDVAPSTLVQFVVEKVAQAA